MHSHEHTVRLTIRDAEVRYANHTALICNSLEIESSIFGVIGPNGAGKSTLIKTLLGLLLPRKGDIAAYSVDYERLHKLIPERHMAYCPEMGAVFNDISVSEYLKFWCRLRHGYKSDLNREGKRYLDLLDLWPLLKKKGACLSKGERQRVQTCAGFLLKPRLFLFDEPFDGLDVQRTQELVALVESHLDETTYIITSHRMDVIERLARSLIVLNKGNVICTGTASEVGSHLAGETLTVIGLTPGHNLKNALASIFPKALIAERGTECSITGSGLTATELNQLLLNRAANAEAVPHPPSLTDAMTLYLRSLSA